MIVIVHLNERDEHGNILETVERSVVERVLDQHAGNVTHAAAALGIYRQTLQRKLRKWGLLTRSAIVRGRPTIRR